MRIFCFDIVFIMLIKFFFVEIIKEYFFLSVVIIYDFFFNGFNYFVYW